MANQGSERDRRAIGLATATGAMLGLLVAFRREGEHETKDNGWR